MGAGHRAFDPQWGKALLAQCGEYGVSFFMKQMSAATPAKGKELIPVGLNVQEFPLDFPTLTK